MLEECGGCAGAPIEKTARCLSYSSSVSTDTYVCVLSAIIHGKNMTFLVDLLRGQLCLWSVHVQ